MFGFSGIFRGLVKGCGAATEPVKESPLPAERSHSRMIPYCSAKKQDECAYDTMKSGLKFPLELKPPRAERVY